MAAGVHKPRGLTAFDAEAFRAHFWPRDIRELWGVGPKLSERMRSLGISTVGELAHAPEPILKGAFGVIGPQLKSAAWGEDETLLVPYHQGVEAKSMGHEVTMPADVADRESVKGTLLRLSDQVARRLRGEGYVGRVVAIKLRDHRFRTRIRQRAVEVPLDDHALIYSTVCGLLDQTWKGEPLRLIGVSVSSLERRTTGTQEELFVPNRRIRTLRETMDRLRNRLGESSLVPAGSLGYRRELGHVPFGTPARRKKP
jgi:DNA polymerase-4